TDIYLTTTCMLVVLQQGGFGAGGINFDAKVRRESFEPVDLFHAHIGGMDAFARGLKIAAQMRKDGVFSRFIADRYASWGSGIGTRIEKGEAKFEDLEKYMLEKGDAAANVSGRQEYLENVFNQYL
ncbi:MAG TPA: xylose isomerase, partial [Gemmatales bacterium]|nr:xylose isomerase [Gemmatales bacterium]